MKLIKNSSQPNKDHNQEAVTQNETQQEKKTKSKTKTKKETEPKKMGSIFLLREKPWSNFIQKDLLLFVAQSDFKHTANCQWLNRGHN